MPVTTGSRTPIRKAFTIGRDIRGHVLVTVQTAAGPQTLIGGYRETREALTQALCALTPNIADRDEMRARMWRHLVEATRKTLDPQAAANDELTVDAIVEGITAFTYRCDEYENGWFPTDITVDSTAFGVDVNLDLEPVVRDDTSFKDEADDPDLYDDLLEIAGESIFTRGWILVIERPTI